MSEIERRLAKELKNPGKDPFTVCMTEEEAMNDHNEPTSKNVRAMNYSKYSLLRRGVMQLANVCAQMEGASREQVDLLADATGFNAIDPVRRDPKKYSALLVRLQTARADARTPEQFQSIAYGILDELDEPEAS